RAAVGDGRSIYVSSGRLLPGGHAAAERPRVREALAAILGRLTGSRRLRGSRTEEDDLLALRQRGQPRLERAERDAAVEADLPAFRLVGVGAHKERLAGRDVGPGLRDTDAKLVC